LAYESIIRNAPIVVPAILAAGIIAVTLYRPQLASAAPDVASMAAKSGSGPIVCADTLARSMHQGKDAGAAYVGVTDREISQGCP
jgi:hypothetical protein